MIDFTRKKEIENERGIGRKKHFFFSFKIFNCLEKIIAQKKKKKAFMVGFTAFKK